MLLDHATPGDVNRRDARGRAALHLAVSGEGRLETVLFLLGVPGVDVNVTDARGTTPLHWAAVCNRPDMCKVLVAKGAAIMFRDSNNMTAMHYATQKGFDECATVLQKLAAPPPGARTGNVVDRRA